MPPLRIMTAEQATKRLQDMCARAEHSKHELAQKMQRWGVAPSVAQSIIAELERDRYVDDNRFARAFVRDKYRFARWGRRKIQQALHGHGIARDIIASALAEIDEAEYANILNGLLAAKIRTNSELIATYEGRTRLYRFALQRGFEPPLITQAIKSQIPGPRR